MIFQADKIDWQETDSVLEALILEAFLIKKHQPKYNTKEKSNKSFNYVCITREVLPKVLIIRGRSLQKKQENFTRLTLSGVRGRTHTKQNSPVSFVSTFGPFTNGSQLRDAMKIIRRIFPYIDAQSAKRDNFEFYRQLGLTPDIGNKELEVTYKKNIANLKLFFQGKKKRIISNFKKEMMQYAKNKEFERASEMKKRIFALTHINDVALLKSDNLNPNNSSAFALGDKRQGTHDTLNYLDSSEKTFRIEAYDIAHMGGKNMVGVMTVVEDGQVAKHEYKKFKIRTQSNANDTGALTEVLERRFTHNEWQFPGLIVVDGSTAQINAAKKILNKIGVDIPIVSVVKDERHKPMNIKGDSGFNKTYEKDILLANNEAHRFAIVYHKNMRSKNFLGLHS
jgi:excinuclease UvrABC nuclease subunit